MKISYNWIREFVELSLSPAAAADRLVNAGIEVASVTRVAPEGLSGVLVGEIEAIERELGESHGHRIVLCRVSTGRERFSVICGAPNAAVGVRAAFAPPGATLPGAPFRAPETAVKESGDPVADFARVRIEAPDLCARYTVRVISDVRVGPSPAWMAARLRAVGLRPISNVVDVTNYVLWELGHPLHAFDHAAVREATIVVRRARAGERFRTLDGQERALDDSMLVIADPRRAIGIAGVMGGADTEVTDGTTRVLLESAWFDPVSIRRTSRALGLKTDAAYRFERGADIEALVDASARAAQLIAELAGGAVAHGMVDAYPRRRRPRRIRLRMERAKRVLGVLPPPSKAKAILARLGLPTRQKGRDLEIEGPSFRRDLT